MQISIAANSDIDVTADFDNAMCFEAGQTYRLRYRNPLSPGVKTGISLKDDNYAYRG